MSFIDDAIGAYVDQETAAADKIGATIDALDGAPAPVGPTGLAELSNYGETGVLGTPSNLGEAALQGANLAGYGPPSLGSIAGPMKDAVSVMDALGIVDIDNAPAPSLPGSTLGKAIGKAFSGFGGPMGNIAGGMVNSTQAESQNQAIGQVAGMQARGMSIDDAIAAVEDAYGKAYSDLGTQQQSALAGVPPGQRRDMMSETPLGTAVNPAAASQMAAATLGLAPTVPEFGHMPAAQRAVAQQNFRESHPLGKHSLTAKEQVAQTTALANYGEEIDAITADMMGAPATPSMSLGLAPSNPNTVDVSAIGLNGPSISDIANGYAAVGFGPSSTPTGPVGPAGMAPGTAIGPSFGPSFSNPDMQGPQAPGMGGGFGGGVGGGMSAADAATAASEAATAAHEANMRGGVGPVGGPMGPASLSQLGGPSGSGTHRGE